MDLFEYILILTSVIYALAIAQILSGVSRMAQSAIEVRGYLPQKIWSFNLFVFAFLVWWATWEFRDVSWTFFKYAYLLIAPTLLFFISSLLTPVDLVPAGGDIEAHFTRVKKPFFVTYLLFIVAVIIDGNVVAGETLWHSGRYGHFALLVAAAWGYFASDNKSQSAVAITTTIAIFATTAIRFWVPR